MTINLREGENVTCTFTNTPAPAPPGLGSITIVKDAVLDGPQDFSFTTTGGLPPATFSLDDDAAPTCPAPGPSRELTPDATYTFTEAAVDPVGAELRGPAPCTVPNRNGGSQSAHVGTRTLTVTLGAGESVTCTFTNTAVAVELAPGSITIVKDAILDDPREFSFTTSGGLLPATFSLDDDAASTCPAPGPSRAHPRRHLHLHRGLAGPVGAELRGRRPVRCRTATGAASRLTLAPAP